MSISFDVPDHDHKLIRAIAKRARGIDWRHNRNKAFSARNHEMNITACHANGCRLRLIDLLEADDLNFAHDVFGIHRHLCCDTGKLLNHFRPRFAVPEHHALDDAA